MAKKISALDLFAGAGGFSCGMMQAGIDIVAAIEFDSRIALTYKENHPSTVVINEDIRKVAAAYNGKNENTEKQISSIKEIFDNQKRTIDIIFGGPPCQGFSMAGKRIRKAESTCKDERNYLFLEFLRMVKILKPKVIVIENVPGVMNYDNGNVMKEIKNSFSVLGYNVVAQVLSAENYGVPQKRKRSVIIGNRMGINSNELFPPKERNAFDYVTVWDAISDLPSLESGEGMEISSYEAQPQTSYQSLMRKNSAFLFNHVASVHTKKTIDIIKLVKPGQTIKDLPIKYQTKSVHSGAYGRMLKDEPSYTITTRLNTPSVGRITHPIDNRTITPREAARIQSFPDYYRFFGDVTSIGMQIGNSVPPLLGKALGESIIANVFMD